jgi:hypothetical protein
MSSFQFLFPGSDDPDFYNLSNGFRLIPFCRAFSFAHVRILALNLSVDNNLALGYCDKVKRPSEAARELAKRSVAARRRKWGNEGFLKKMREWGRLGGRPKKGNRNEH